MQNIPSLVVSAVTTFDGKALAKGEKQIGGFSKTVKSLGKALGAAFSVTAILAFGKASVKAFAEDEKAAVRLTRTVNNLGLGFENTRITKFISDLEKTANVADDVLRPAFQTLLTTTGSVEKSQNMLALALDVAAGSGEDVATVANDLANAYVGNTKGLNKYRLGLTKAELAGKGFNDIQELLNAQFSGQNAARLDTYEGKMAALSVSFGNMQETVGKGLVEAFQILAGDGGIEGATTAMEKFGEKAANVLVGTASYVDKLLEKLNSLGGKGGGFDWVSLIPILGGYLGSGGVVDALEAEGRKVTGKDKQYGGVYADQYNMQKEAAAAKARAKAEAEAARRQKELLAMQKKSALAEKNKLSLSKAAAVFDTNRVSIAAALRATYDKETILRLEALQAIEEDNGELALKKISELAALQKNADLAKLAGVKEISEATLSALNTQLLAELGVIDKSKMAEADKELAREEAFRKYNAAIVAAGQLAAKEQYSERTQIQLTEIARLASQSNTTSALKTQVLLREQAELSMIDRVAAAQKKADDARLAALKTYLALLTGGDLAADPNFAKASPEAQQEIVDATKAAIDALTPELIDPATSDALKAADAVLALAASITPRGTLSSYKQAELDSAVMLNSVGGGGSSRNNVYNLNFTTGVISQPDEFATLLQDTIQKLNRGGDPLTVAGAL
jgi:hypothetical protein